jgi:hypothetical protein
VNIIQARFLYHPSGVLAAQFWLLFVESVEIHRGVDAADGAFTAQFWSPILLESVLGLGQNSNPNSSKRPAPRRFLGVTLRRWLEYLVAILIGQAIYYYSLVPHLPMSFRHQDFRIDLGMLLDFFVCVAVYGLIRIASSL